MCYSEALKIIQINLNTCSMMSMANQFCEKFKFAICCRANSASCQKNFFCQSWKRRTNLYIQWPFDFRPGRYLGLHRYQAYKIIIKHTSCNILLLPALDYCPELEYLVFEWSLYFSQGILNVREVYCLHINEIYFQWKKLLYRCL